MAFGVSRTPQPTYLRPKPKGLSGAKKFVRPSTRLGATTGASTINRTRPGAGGAKTGGIVDRVMKAKPRKLITPKRYIGSAQQMRQRKQGTQPVPRVASPQPFGQPQFQPMPMPYPQAPFQPPQGYPQPFQPQPMPMPYPQQPMPMPFPQQPQPFQSQPFRQFQYQPMQYGRY